MMRVMVCFIAIESRSYDVKSKLNELGNDLLSICVRFLFQGFGASALAGRPGVATARYWWRRNVSWILGFERVRACSMEY